MKGDIEAAAGDFSGLCGENYLGNIGETPQNSHEYKHAPLAFENSGACTIHEEDPEEDPRDGIHGHCNCPHSLALWQSIC